MTSPLLALLLTGCAPQDATVNGTWHAWLAANNSATVDEGRLDLAERATRIYDCKRGWDDETDDWDLGYIGPRTGEEAGSDKYFGGDCDPDDDSCTEDVQAKLDAECSAINDLDYYTFLQDDGYYYLTEPLDVWRSEALMNGEGDFQLTVHNRLGNGQDMRFNFVIKPDFAPVDCVDTDGDGVASVEYVDGAPWAEQWSADEDGYTMYYLNAGAYQVEPSGGSSGPGSESEDPEYWYFTSEWSAGFSISKFAAEEFTVRPPDYGQYDEAGEGPNYNLVQDIREECASSRSSVPPLVAAGPDAHMVLGETLTLDGSGTTDVDGDALTYTWKVNTPSNSGASMVTDGSTGTFTPVSAGSYTVALEVFDGTWRVSEVINVTVEDPNHVPYCDAVGDMLVAVGDTVPLDASATDIDGDPLEYAWAWIDPSGTLVESAETGPVLPVTFNAEGAYQVLVDATDPSGETCRSAWVVNATAGPQGDNPPLCYAGGDMEGSYGETFDLDAAFATDTEGGDLTYQWSVAAAPSGAAAGVDPDGADSPLASFTPDKSGTWELRLDVFDDDDDGDGTTLTCSSTIAVTVRNTAPLCDVPGNVYAALGEPVELASSSLVDIEGNSVTSTWTGGTVPECSTAALVDNGDGTATLDRDVGGVYSATYSATDGDKTCNRTVTVQASCDDIYDGAYACHQGDAEQWSKELSHVAMAGVSMDEELSGEPGFVHRTESNSWRPIDDRDAGLDGWAEVASSWVRIADGAQLEVGGQASGDFQIMLQGFESSSFMVVSGTFEVDKIRKDAWAYPNLEDEKRDENGTPYCGGDTVE